MAGLDGYTKLLAHFDGTDGQTTYTAETGQTLTFVADAQLDTAQKKFGTASLLLDGTGDYLTVPDSDDWYFGTGDFTIDCWFRLAAGTDSGDNKRYAIAAQTKSVYDNDDLWRFNLYQLPATNHGYIEFEVIDTDGGGAVSVTVEKSGGKFAAETWYHLALVRTGNDFMVFLNGTQVGTTVTDTSAVPNLTGVLYLGISEDATSYPFNGHIDEIRISKGIARWTANFTPPTSEYSKSGNYQAFII